MRNGAQRGQALSEALAVIALFMAIGMAILTVARLQWQGLRAIHASREAAFRYAQGQRTMDRPGVEATLEPALAFHAGPGGSRLGPLRRDLGVEDRGMVIGRAAFTASDMPGSRTALILRRHIAVLSGASHAQSDRHAQRQLVESKVAWRQAADLSLGAGKAAVSGFGGIDLAWDRPRPRLEWLADWADLVPSTRLRSARSLTRSQP